MADLLHIVCLRPGGLNRGGTRHERHAAHGPGAFAPAQLREMLAEPDLVLIQGGSLLTEGHVAALETIEAKAAAKAKG